MASAAPSSSSPSSSHPRSKRTAAFIVELPLSVDWDLMMKRRHCSVDDVMGRSRVVPEYTYYANLLCEICGSGDRDDELLVCDGCDRGHHTFCLRPVVAQVPRGPWFCPVCAQPAKEPKSLPLNQTKIFNFDGIQKDKQDAMAAKSKSSQGFPLSQTDEQDEEKDEWDAQATEARLSQDEQMDEQDSQTAESRLTQGFPLNQMDKQDDEKDELDAQAAESQGFQLNQMDEKDERDAKAAESSISEALPANIMELALPMDWDLLPKQRYCSVDDLMGRTRVVREYSYYANLLCKTCGSGDREDDLLLCDGCDCGHHTFCLRPIVAVVSADPWFCPVCAPPAMEPETFPQNQTNGEQDAQAAVCAPSPAKEAESFPLNQTDMQLDEQDEHMDEKDEQIDGTDEQMHQQDRHIFKQEDGLDAQAAESKISQGFPMKQMDKNIDEQDEDKDEQDAQADESRLSQGFLVNEMDEQDEEMDEQDGQATESRLSQGNLLGFSLNQTDEQMDEQDAQATESRLSQGFSLNQTDEQMDEQDEQVAQATESRLSQGFSLNATDEQDAQATKSSLSQGFPLNQTDEHDEQKEEQDTLAAESRLSLGFPIKQTDKQDGEKHEHNGEKDEQDAQATESRLSQGFSLNQMDEEMNEKDEQDPQAAENSIPLDDKDVPKHISKICTASSTTEKSNAQKMKRIHSGGLGTNKNNLQVDDVSIEVWNKFLAKRAFRKGFKIKGQSQPPSFIEICGFYITYDEFYDSFKARGLVSNEVMTLWSYNFNLDQLQLFEDGKTTDRKFAFSPQVTRYLSVDPASFNHEKTCKKAYTKINETFPFTDMELIFFPILCVNHWVLVCVSMSMGKIAFFDSLSAPTGTSCLDSAENLILNFAATTTKYGFLKNDVSDFEWSFPPRYPKQENLIDCGIFTMDYMDSWNGTKMAASSLENGIVLEYRKNAAQLLLKSAHNKVKLDEFMKKYNGKET